MRLHSLQVGLYTSFILTINLLQHFTLSNNHIYSPCLRLTAAWRSCILDWRENSGESSLGTKFAVAESEKLQESGQIEFPELLPVRLGEPRSNCRRFPGTQLPCNPETLFTGDFLRFKISALAWAFEIKIGTGKIEKGFSSPMLATSSHVYEFD